MSDLAEPVILDESFQRIFVVGDIHGCAAELSVLLDYLRGEQGVEKEDAVVFVGDYIDRGPDSKGVVDLLLNFEEECFAHSVFLEGNHEDMLLGFLGLGGTSGEVYLANGGVSFFKSYDLSHKDSPDELQEGIPKEHLEFFQELDRYVIHEKYVVAHAGLNPLRDLKHQLNDDLFWIRDEFINNMHYFKRTVVFGHTPFEDIFFHLPYKIGIDTGLVYGNAITCVELLGEEVFQIESGSEEVEEFSFKMKGARWPEYG